MHPWIGTPIIYKEADASMTLVKATHKAVSIDYTDKVDNTLYNKEIVWFTSQNSALSSNVTEIRKTQFVI